MFIIKTKEEPASHGLPRRVIAYRDGILHSVNTWTIGNSPEWNHCNVALRSLKATSGIHDFTPHHIIGAAPVPGEDFWVVAVQEGE
jgi:hypothetical protein